MFEYLAKYWRFYFCGGSLIAALSSAPLSAQTLSNREELQDSWSNKQKTRHNIYETSPATHIVPEFNTITYATRGEKIDAEVVPEEDKKNSYSNSSLKLSGYTVAPHMAVSLKNIGLGFSGEAGQRRAVYAYDTTAIHARQESLVDYRGLGLYLYWIVPQPFKSLQPSLTLGYSSYTSKHQVSSLEAAGTTLTENTDIKTFSYNVGHSEAGLNLSIVLLKNFTLIPWAHYDIFDTSEGSKKADDAATNYDTTRAAILRDDLDLFWHSSNRFKYGLDFSVRMFSRVAIHVGGLLGLLASSSFNNDAVTDKSVSLGFSFDQKGN